MRTGSRCMIECSKDRKRRYAGGPKIVRRRTAFPGRPCVRRTAWEGRPTAQRTRAACLYACRSKLSRPSVSAMNEHSMQQFMDACQATSPLQLRLEGLEFGAGKEVEVT